MVLQPIEELKIIDRLDDCSVLPIEEIKIIKKEIVREVARGDKHYLKGSAARKAQISKVFFRSSN